MADLSGSTIATTYQAILALPLTGGDTSTLVALTDGDGVNTFALKVATTSIAIGATHRLGFDGTNSGTYISESANDILDFYSGGTHMLSLDKTNLEVVVNEDSAVMDFRVEGGDDLHLLFCDASADKVGIGHATPVAKLEVNTVSSTDDDNDPVCHFIRTITGNKSDGNSSFFFQDKSSNKNPDIGLFGISNSGDAGLLGNLFRIEQDGRVGIGIVDPGATAHVHISDIAINTAVSNIGLLVNRKKTHGATDSSDHIYGAQISMEFDDDVSLNSSFGTLAGLVVGTTVTDSYGDCTSVSGIINNVTLQTGASIDIENVYGYFSHLNLEVGTIDASVYGQYINVDLDAGMSIISGSVFGQYILVDDDQSALGKVYGVYIDGDTNIDYGLIVDGGSVGIGTATPESLCHIKSTADTLSSTVHVLQVEDDDSTVAAGAVLVRLDFSGDNDVYTQLAKYISFHDGDNAEIGYIAAATDATSFNTAMVDVSDVRLKTDIKDSSMEGLNIINALKVRDFKWGELSAPVCQGKQAIGKWIADEVYEVYPLAAIGKPGQMKDVKDSDGEKVGEEMNPMGIAITQFIAPMMKAIQELSAKVTALENA